MTRRVIAYTIGAASAALLAMTVSPTRLAAFETVPSVALFSVVLGVLDSGLAPALARIPGLSGCWPFTLVAFVVNAATFWLASRLVPGVTITPIGAIVGGAAAAAAAAAVFTLIDERTGGE